MTTLSHIEGAFGVGDKKVYDLFHVNDKSRPRSAAVIDYRASQVAIHHVNGRNYTANALKAEFSFVIKLKTLLPQRNISTADLFCKNCLFN